MREIKLIKGKKNGRDWQGLLVVIGEWSQVIFPKSRFEMEYILKNIGEDVEVVIVPKKG